jgi:hypothetical protein
MEIVSNSHIRSVLSGIEENGGRGLFEEEVTRRDERRELQPMQPSCHYVDSRNPLWVFGMGNQVAAASSSGGIFFIGD